jgi:ATP-dependent helicase/nuclease subunit A
MSRTQDADKASLAQQRAADPDACVWVSANAGTGKTHLLIDRVTRLLLRGADPGRILCLSFTRAAAAEMQDRLFRRLGLWATLSDDRLRGQLQDLLHGAVDAGALDGARTLFARALETPGGLKIRTIHAFCESVLRRFPIEARVARHFEVLDDRAAAELRAQARQELLAYAQTGDDPPLQSALQEMVRRIDEPAFIELSDEMIHLRTPGGPAQDARQRALYRFLGVDWGAEPATLIAEFAEALPRQDLLRAANALLQGTDKDKDRAAVILEFLEAAQARAEISGELSEAYRKVFLNQDDSPSAERNLITKAAQRSDPDAAAILQREQERVLSLQQKRRALLVARSSAAAQRITQALRAAYQELKDARALLDYDDLITLTVDLLKSRGAAWVHYKLDEGLDHILVDEAQDTSPEQWEIIRLLSDDFFSGLDARREAREQRGEGPRTLFAVGDEKQSIFSFQGADPASFAHMRDYFSGRASNAALEWRDIPLQASYRSTPEVLGAVDLVFAQGAPAHVGLAQAEAAVSHKALRAGHRGRVEIWPPVKEGEIAPPGPWDEPDSPLAHQSARRLLAERIAEHIQALLREGPVLPATGSPVRPDDIMILVRTRSDFVEECIRQLKSRNIAVAGADRMRLLEQMAVMDLMAAGRFALLPEDDLTLATLLRSPFIGLSEELLLDLAHNRQRSVLWDELCRRREENADFRNAHESLVELRRAAGAMPPYDFYALLLGARGGRRRLLGRLGPEANDPIDEFLAMAARYERTHAATLQGFLHWTGSAETQIKRDMEQRAGAVRVMTVHAAKGLQAPVVYLPDTCSIPDGKFDSKLIPVPEEDIFLWPVARKNDDPKTAEMRARLAVARRNEYHRLLYVAMTRAQDWLFVTGHEGRQKRPSGCWYDLMREALAPAAQEIPLPWGETGWRIEADRMMDGKQETAPPAARVDALPEWAKRPAPPEPRPHRPLAPSRLDTEDETSFPPRRNAEGRFKRGRLIHQLLQYLPGMAPEARAAAGRRFLAQRGFALSPGEVEEMLGQALRVLETPEFAAIFGPGSLAEVSVAGLLPAFGTDMAISGQIDRLVVREEEILILDYKTNFNPPDSAEATPRIYVRQMAAYRSALQSIYPDRPVRCALIWTAVPILTPLPERLLDLAFASP